MMVLRLGLHMYKVEIVNLHKWQILQMNENTVALVITPPSAPMKMGPLNCHYMDPINLKQKENTRQQNSWHKITEHMLNKLLRNEKDNWSPKTIWSLTRATKSYKNHVCKYLSDFILVRSTFSLNLRRDKNILIAYLIPKDLFLYLYDFFFIIINMLSVYHRASDSDKFNSMFYTKRYYLLNRTNYVIMSLNSCL